MLTIGRVRMRLPAGFEARAQGIAGLLAEELAAWEPGASRRIERLSVPPVGIGANASDREIARTIARAIASTAGFPKREQA